MRPSGRKPDQMRPVRFATDFTRHAEGSVLAEFGDTRVICTATVENRVPPWLRGTNKGWVTGEYGMLPRATHSRTAREAARGRQGGRTMEIQRLIGRSLRAAVDLGALGERTVTLDCDVIQADGGTRTAAICGGYVALHDARACIHRREMLRREIVQLLLDLRQLEAPLLGRLHAGLACRRRDGAQLRGDVHDRHATAHHAREVRRNTCRLLRLGAEARRQHDIIRHLHLLRLSRGRSIGASAASLSPSRAYRASARSRQ